MNFRKAWRNVLPLILMTLTVVQDAKAGELFKLTADLPMPGDFFGNKVDISGDVAIVAARGDNEFGDNSGAAYLFDVTTGVELFKLTASDAISGHGFGRDVAIDGNVAVVGAASDSEFGESSGAAYVFDVSSGRELVKLVPEDVIPEQQFGETVDISGNLAIVSDGISNSGYLFDVTTGTQLHKFVPPTEFEDGYIFTQVGIRGDRIVIGAQFDNDKGNNAGAAFLYDAVTLQLLATFVASDATESQFFGCCFSFDEELLVVGAEEKAHFDRGVAYVFNTESGDELTKVDTPETDNGDDFAWSIGVSGDNLCFWRSKCTSKWQKSGTSLCPQLVCRRRVGRAHSIRW